jgi:hypothetical protein
MNEEQIEILYNVKYGGWGISKKAEELYQCKKCTDDKLDISYDLSYRTDPILIEIYKELGTEFDDEYSKTKIKQIPKKYENYYEIHEYDGKESITINYTKYKLDEIHSKIKSIVESSYSNRIKIQEIQKMIGTFQM